MKNGPDGLKCMMMLVLLMTSILQRMSVRAGQVNGIVGHQAIETHGGDGNWDGQLTIVYLSIEIHMWWWRWWTILCIRTHFRMLLLLWILLLLLLLLLLLPLMWFRFYTKFILSKTHGVVIIIRFFCYSIDSVPFPPPIHTALYITPVRVRMTPQKAVGSLTKGCLWVITLLPDRPSLLCTRTWLYSPKQNVFALCHAAVFHQEEKNCMIQDYTTFLVTKFVGFFFVFQTRFIIIPHKLTLSEENRGKIEDPRILNKLHWKNMCV